MCLRKVSPCYCKVNFFFRFSSHRGCERSLVLEKKKKTKPFFHLADEKWAPNSWKRIPTWHKTLECQKFVDGDLTLSVSLGFGNTLISTHLACSPPSLLHSPYPPRKTLKIEQKPLKNIVLMFSHQETRVRTIKKQFKVKKSNFFLNFFFWVLENFCERCFGCDEKQKKKKKTA